MNKKTKKTAVIVVGGILTVGVGYLIYNLFKAESTAFDEEIDSTQAGGSPNNNGSPSDSVYKDQGFPLRKFSGGEDVKKLQRFLNDSGSHGLTVDGKFGTKTEQAVISEQEPFASFKSMYTDAVKGQVTKEYFDQYIASF